MLTGGWIMDFLQTLLIYMMTMFTLAVGNAAPPSETPEPIAKATPVIVLKAEPSATSRSRIVIGSPSPTPTVSVTPQPVPTITPNNAYHNLKTGDRGPEVKALQTKLIELGYLPKGADDGAYGNQTRRAVMWFQYYNGLSKDGIAGRATQTNLFENPEVQPMPEPTEVTPTPIAAEIVTPVPRGETDKTEESEGEQTDKEADEKETDEETSDEESSPGSDSAESSAEPDEEPAAESSAQPVEIGGSIVLNDGGMPVFWVGPRDGVMEICYPRILRSGDRFWASIEELSKGIESWIMTEEGGHIILEAEGNTAVITLSDAGKPEMMVNGSETRLKDDDIVIKDDGIFIDLDLLAKSMNGTAEWDEDEETLMLRIPHKDAIGTDG